MDNTPFSGGGNSGDKQKGFWERPEGTTGMIFGVALGSLVLYLLYKLMPFIVTLLHNTLTALLLAVAIGSILYVVYDNKFRTLISYMYKVAMRKVTSAFIELDPLKVAEVYISNLEEKLGEVDDQRTKLRGQMGILQKTVEKNTGDIEQALEMASTAKKQGKQDMFTLESRQAERLKESITAYNELYKKEEVLYNILGKMRDGCAIFIEDTKNEIKQKKQEYQMISTGYSAMKSALRIIQGGKDEKAIFDEAMENLADTIGDRVGQMQNFMDQSKNFLDSIDLQSGVIQEKGIKLLEDWETKGTSIFLDDPKNKQQIASSFSIEDTNQQNATQTTDDYNSFFSHK